LKIDEKSNKMKLPNPTTVIVVAVVLILMSSTVVIFFPLVSEQQQQQSELDSVLKLARANVPIDIPLSKGYIDGNIAYFIATDASDKKAASSITNNTGFPVNYAPLLNNTPKSIRGQGYVFLNGIQGEAPGGVQLPVANAVPGDEDYSPLWQTNFVKWNDNATARELKSVEEIMDAQKNGELTITETNIIVNSPALKWQSGSLQVKENKTITDDTPYGGGQVLNIDTEKMVVTMVAHRGWGPDGKTIYYIVTDATPKMPADMMGVPFVQSDEKLIGSPIVVDIFQFTNGINGSGPLGFQAGIGAANPTDPNYSPMWRISFIEWNDPSNAKVLQTVNDIIGMSKDGMITIKPAINGTHVVNCPFFDQSTVIKYQSKL
jgi:hypothetical protein